MSISSNRPVTLLIRGRYLVTQDRERTIIDNGGVAVAGDTIVEIGPGRELLARYPGVEVIDEPRGLIMPGLVNTHTHAAMACFRGLADDLPLMQWLQEYIFPAEARLTGEVVFHSTLLSIAEMIRSGTTSFCDMYLFAREVARAAAAAGMRGWVGEVLYDFPSPNYGPLAEGIRYTEELLGMYRQDPLITVTVDPHAVYTCGPELLKQLKELADKHDALYVIHLSENKEEVRAAKERFGCSPVIHLDRLGILDERVLADHCVELTREEIELLAARGVKVAHCPESNMKLASGVAPVPGLLAAGVTVGLGTDGSASNNNVDMFGEMNSAALLHKVFSQDPTVLDARTSLDLATVGGAAALSAKEMIGSLEPGKKADIIVLDMNQPHLTPVYNLPSHLVYAARGNDVVHSVINGRVVMRNQRLLTLDEEAVLEKMNELAGKIAAMRPGG
ncbi:MAG: amidohydrolase [Desulfobacterales bacterium]|nr:amidohydrolase [Desulfobacterales bacterium]